jgi:uncharacterized protein with PQ loop repeat
MESMIVESLGWIAGIFFAICGIPQAIDCWKKGHAKGLSDGFLACWFLGEVLMTMYVLLKHGFDGPLLFNYAGNLLSLLVILKYRFIPIDRSYQYEPSFEQEGHSKQAQLLK